MDRIKFNLIGVSLVSVLFLFSCEKETIVVDDISTEMNRLYDLAAPLMNLHVNVADLLEEFDGDTLFEEAADGTLFRTYDQDISFEWNDVLELDDVVYDWTFQPVSLPEVLPLFLKAATESVVFTEEIVINQEEGVRLDSLTIFLASMEIVMEAPPELNEGIIRVTLPEVISDGRPFSFEHDLQTGSSFLESFDLAGSKIEFSHSVQEPSGYITFTCEFIDVNLVAAPPLVLPEPVAIHFELLNIEPDVAFGYFGQREVEERTIDVEFEAFDEYDIDGTIEFKDFLISIESMNGIGTPFEVEIRDVLFTDTGTEEQKRLTLDESQYVVAAAQWADPIIPAYSVLEINGSNSNILDILKLGEFLPNEVTGSLLASLNPDNNPSGLNFLSRTSEVQSTLVMSFPLWFKTSLYSRVDTIDFDYNDMVGSDDNVTDNIVMAAIYFEFDNGFPFDITVQAYVMDERYQKVDSLFASSEGEKMLAAAVTDDESGLVTQSVASSLIAKIEQSQLQLWRNRDVRYIFLKTATVTEGEGTRFVKITRSNYLNTTISVEGAGRPE